LRVVLTRPTVPQHNILSFTGTIIYVEYRRYQWRREPWTSFAYGMGETLVPSLCLYNPLLSLLISFPLSPYRLTPDTSSHPHLPPHLSFTGQFRTRILYSIPPFSLFPNLPISARFAGGWGSTLFQSTRLRLQIRHS
jgi:hypothetical protein